MKNTLVSAIAVLVWFCLWGASAVADEAAPEHEAMKRGRAIFGAYLMRHRLYPDKTGSARFIPALPSDDPEILFSAMKALTRELYGTQSLGLGADESVDPGIGKTTELEGMNYVYRFMVDGAADGGISIILVQRREREPVVETSAVAEPSIAP